MVVMEFSSELSTADCCLTGALISPRRGSRWSLLEVLAAGGRGTRKGFEPAGGLGARYSRSRTWGDQRHSRISLQSRGSAASHDFQRSSTKSNGYTHQEGQLEFHCGTCLRVFG